MIDVSGGEMSCVLVKAYVDMRATRASTTLVHENLSRPGLAPGVEASGA